MPNKAAAAGGPERTTAGWVILLVSSCLSALLVIMGLIYATGVGQRNQAALAAAGCEPGLAPSGQPCTTRQMLISQYMAIQTPASRQADADMAAYTASERAHLLAVAETALTAEVTSVSAFDTQLAGMQFPPDIAPAAMTLLRAGQTLAGLTAQQARSSTLTQLSSFDHRVQVADAVVKADMKLILKALDTPAR